MYSDLINVMYSMLADTVELHVENMFGAVMLIRIRSMGGSESRRQKLAKICKKSAENLYYIFTIQDLCFPKLKQ